MSIDKVENESSLDEKLQMEIVAKGTEGVLGKNAVLTVDISDYATAEHLNSSLLEDLGDFEIISTLSNFDGEEFVENNRVLDSVFDLLVSDHLTVREWLILKAWAYKQATPVNFETDKLIEGMRENYVGTFNNTEELAKHHVENNIDTSDYNELIMSNIDYAAMGSDILWRGLYDMHPVQNSNQSQSYCFYN